MGPLPSLPPSFFFLHRQQQERLDALESLPGRGMKPSSLYRPSLSPPAHRSRPWPAAFCKGLSPEDRSWPPLRQGPANSAVGHPDCRRAGLVSLNARRRELVGAEPAVPVRTPIKNRHLHPLTHGYQSVTWVVGTPRQQMRPLRQPPTRNSPRWGCQGYCNTGIE